MCELKIAVGNTKTGSLKNSLVMTSIQVSIPGYRINEQLYNGSRTLVYRAIRETDSIPVVIKLLKNPYPSFTELVQFRNQYTIAKNLNLPGIIQTYSLEVYQNGYALVMEFGGISLKEYFVSVETRYIAFGQEFLEVAIALCDTLDILIRSRIIHKDIKPANILINPETKQVKLIDFSIASLLPRETQILMSPNVLEGTLGYLSPEQTGRMNRGIDYRTDFYSLGVTFYELLTGKLPFESNDAMELVHCHIAKLPPSLSEKRQDIPKVISNIVMKLMAKNAEDRYQSASGLKYDLETCLHQLKQTGKIDDFQIAQRDLCDRFVIPEKSALIFGPGDRGLSNEELNYAQKFIRIPTDSIYPVLNLAMAVGICCYELAENAKQSNNQGSTKTELAPLEVVEVYYQQLESLLLQIGYLYPHTAASRMEKFRQLYNRAGLRTKEVAMLQGILRQVEWAMGGKERSRKFVIHRLLCTDRESKVKSQKSKVKSQKSKVKSQKSKVESQKSKVKSQKSKVKSQKSKVRSLELEYTIATK